MSTRQVLKPPRQVSPGGITTLKRLESKNGKPELVSYQDDAGVWTWGFGHTGADIGPGFTGTAALAEAFLDDDLDKVEWAICKYVAYTQLNDNQFDALALLLYNAGTAVLFMPQFSAAIAPNAATGKINLGNVAAQFPKWVHVTNSRTKKKEVNNGLVNRRAAELQLWNTPVTVQEDAPVVPTQEVRPAFEPVSIPRMVIAPAPVTMADVRRPDAAEPSVSIPAHIESASPEAPPVAVSKTPGGKSFIVTIGGVIAGAIGQGYQQIVDIATQASKVKSGVEGLGSWAQGAAFVASFVVMGIALYAYWARHRELRKSGG